ncbi:hypothetical protein [Paenibacillus antibioticophila]|uniref:hypothetical protein n=1 Tax=Paenibacillus antibioticophila TaxID=1274374 RepID=UPI0013052EBD|nr:hypothetical protein [Paenibacillus antibioticophila]
MLLWLVTYSGQHLAGVYAWFALKFIIPVAGMMLVIRFWRRDCLFILKEQIQHQCR